MTTAEVNERILQAQAKTLVEQTNRLNEYLTLVGTPASALRLVNDYAAALAEVRSLRAQMEASHG